MSINQCHVTVDCGNEYTVIAISGALDAINGKKFAQTLSPEFIGSDLPILFDFSRADSVVGNNLRILLDFYKQVHGKNRMAICCGSGPVQELFEFAGFSRLFDVYENIEDAKIALRQIDSHDVH